MMIDIYWSWWNLIGYFGAEAWRITKGETLLASSWKKAQELFVGFRSSIEKKRNEGKKTSGYEITDDGEIVYHDDLHKFQHKLEKVIDISSPSAQELNDFSKLNEIPNTGDKIHVDQSWNNEECGDRSRQCSEDSNRECSGGCRESIDRKYVAKQCSEQIYSDLEQAARENGLEQDTIQLVSEHDIVEGEGTVAEELRSNAIVSISAVEFVKAAAAGKSIQSLVFDPYDKDFHWNFTNTAIDISDAWHLIGKNNCDEILDESNFNANGWVQPRYFYDSASDIYTKVETGVCQS